MIIKNEDGFGWGSLLISILLFIASWISLSSPTETIMTLGLFFGVIAIVQGFLSIILYFGLSRIFDRNAWPIIVIGIFDLLIGLYLIMNPNISIKVLPVLFAVWFIADSIRNIVIAFRLRRVRQRWFWIHLGLGILGMILGILMATNLSIAIISISSIIAFYFFIAAVLRLIDAFI